MGTNVKKTRCELQRQQRLDAMQAQLEARATELRAVRAPLRAAGWDWPPQPWQRVEISGNRYPRDPAGQLLGTVISRNGSYTMVLADCDGEVRECYWDNELRPLLADLAPGWLFYGMWLSFWLNNSTLHRTYDVQLRNGTTATECYPKQQPGGYYQFQEINKPYRRYDAAEVVALRPSAR